MTLTRQNIFAWFAPFCYIGKQQEHKDRKLHFNHVERTRNNNEQYECHPMAKLQNTVKYMRSAVLCLYKWYANKQVIWYVSNLS